MKTILVDNVTKLSLEVYLIGYPQKGESQIIFLKHEDQETPIFSCVIDCFAHNGLNKTQEILTLNNVDSLNFFIWTHTDEDHSVGIDSIISNCCSDNTEYILPEGVTGNEADFIDYNEDIKAVFETINNFNTGRDYRVHTATVIKGGQSTIFKRKIKDNSSSEIVFDIFAIAPISAIIRRRWESGIAKKKNDLSIATIFRIGELNFLFSGDIENQSIRHMEDFYFEDLTYIKTPHHTSKTSTELLSKIGNVFNGNKIPTGTTTVYTTHNLPDVNLVNEYKKYVDDFKSTGTGTDNYGYVKVVYDISGKAITSIELDGNAHTY